MVNKQHPINNNQAHASELDLNGAKKHIGSVTVSHKRTWMLIGVFLVVVIICTTAGYLWYRSTAVTAAQVEAVAKQADALIEDEEYSQAVAVWQPLMQKPMSESVECLANLKYANTLQANGQYRDANTLYLAVKDNCKNYNEFELTVGIAKSYDGLNDTKMAIEYYQNVVDIEKAKLQSNDVSVDKVKVERNITNYNQVIEELKPYL